jgi:protein-S-isoprenylcysteine O-methyltransferase Ste14
MTDNLIFRLLFAILFVGTFALVAYYRRKAEPAGGQVSRETARTQEGGAIYFSLRILGLFLWIGPFVYMIAPRLLGWASLPLPIWARWTGVLLALLIIAAASWAQSSLGSNVTKTVVTKEEHTLVTAGPYRWIRHPLYTIGVLFFVALSLISANWYFGAVMLLGAVPLFARTRQEEAMLIARFGDQYREYMKRTGRFLPRLV